MSEILFLPIDEAERRAKNTTQQLWSFLEDFNARHPELEAKAVSSRFDFFTQDYILRACASVIAEKYVITSRESALDTTVLFHKKRAQRVIRFTAEGDVMQFAEDKPTLLSHSQ
jgi:hypothetical protein